MIGKLIFTYNRVQYITHNKNIKGEQNFELLRTECCLVLTDAYVRQNCKY